MRKLMIAMLALAVVFGFAACDNSNSGSTSLMDKYVVALEITEGPTQYFDGDTLDKDQYTVMATQNDGQKVQLASSDFDFNPENGGIVATPSLANAKAEEKTIGTFTYAGIYQGTLRPAAVEVKATVYSIDKINVSVPEEMGQYWNSESVSDIKKEDYKVTAYALTNPTTDTLSSTPIFSKTYEGDDYDLTCGVLSANDKLTTGVHTLSFSVNDKTGLTGFADGVITAKINVKADKLTGISISRNDVEAVEGATAGDAEKYVDVTYTYASGKTEKKAGNNASDITIAWVNDPGFGSTSTFDAKDQPIKASVTEDSTITAPNNVTVETITDYIKSFTIAATNANKKFAVNDTTMSVLNTAELELSSLITKDDVKITWASGKTTGPSDAPTAAEVRAALTMYVNGVESEYLVLDATDYAADAELPVTFALEGLKYVDERTECGIEKVVAIASIS